MPAIRADAPDTALLIGYEDDDGQSGATLRAVADSLTPLGTRVLDRLVVRQRRWRSLDCANPDCCPPDGTPVPGPVEAPTSVAEFVGQEVCPFPDRDSLAGQLEPGPLAAQVDDILQRLPHDTEAVPPGQTLAGTFSPWRRILDVDDCAGPVTEEDAARAALSLAEVRLRDALIGWLTPGNLPMDVFTLEVQDLFCGLPRPCAESVAAVDPSGTVVAQNRVQARLVALCAMLPDTAAAPVLTVLASFTWWRGNGALTRVALDRALRCDPGYRLALLLDQMVDLAIRPTAR